MIDFAGKIITTDNDIESEKLLHMAVSQGYSLSKGLKVLTQERIFRFNGSPYKIVYIPDETCRGLRIRYADIFGNEDEELHNIMDSAVRWCMTHGYSHVAINVNDEDQKYTGKSFVSDMNGSVKSMDMQLLKPRKISLDEVEKLFGYPVEIVS